MKNLGFNLLILPSNQKLSDFYADDAVSAYMPDTYATRLAEAKIVTIRHLLPSLQEKVLWPERKRTIILIGTRGEVPSMFRDAREPILVAVKKGHAVVGHELAESLGLKAGDRITLFGRTFTVSQCNEERGSKDDISIWIDLAEAQEILGKPGRINAILALKCLCAGNELAAGPAGCRRRSAGCSGDRARIQSAHPRRGQGPRRTGGRGRPGGRGAQPATAPRRAGEILFHPGAAGASGQCALGRPGLLHQCPGTPQRDRYSEGPRRPGTHDTPPVPDQSPADGLRRRVGGIRPGNPRSAWAGRRKSRFRFWIRGCSFWLPARRSFCRWPPVGPRRITRRSRTRRKS